MGGAGQRRSRARDAHVRRKDLVEEREVDRRVVGKLQSAVMQPLPQLGAGDLGGGRVFHQVVDRHAAEAIQPGGGVAQADFDVVLETVAVMVPRHGSIS
jgi:hypothetical protein